MITVFSILSLVVIGGKIMIMLINRYTPVPEISLAGSQGGSGIDSTKVAAISAAVEAITGGRGKITEIKKE